MSAKEILQSFRGKDYGSTSDKKDEGMDSSEQVETPRIISLTDDEQKAFAKSHPGEDLACEVHGTLEEDGHFHVMSVAPMGGDSYGQDENKMAGEVAQRVMPNVIPSPS